MKTFKQDSQNFKILEYLKTGEKLTCLEAANLGFGYNLRSRVSDLKRAGYNVESKLISTNNGTYIAEYALCE